MHAPVLAVYNADTGAHARTRAHARATCRRRREQRASRPSCPLLFPPADILQSEASCSPGPTSRSCRRTWRRLRSPAPPPCAAMSTQQEAKLRDQSHLGQQRRLKQASQFLHKDSADLLPLDSLKRLGTSKDLQPRSVIQRRLVEGRQRGLQGAAPLAQQDSRRKAPSLLVNCKCCDQVLQVAVDTGTPYNQISARCLSRLGLWKKMPQVPGGDLAPGGPAQVDHLELQLGQETVACSAQVVDAEGPELCLGLQTLLSLKCCIDLERGMLKLRAPFSELPFLPLHQEPGQ
ncbi:nuclear receptor-interacting protein 2 [Ctenodactylus gundi]